MSSTPRQHPSVKRVNRAYVEIPPSPLTSLNSRVSGNSIHVVSTFNEQKENTPLRPFHTTMSHIDGASTLFKRKLLDREPSFIFEGTEMPAKKSKLLWVNEAPHMKQVTMNEPAKNISDEFPDGFAYCHQCNKKRGTNDTIVCNAPSQFTTNSGKSKQRACNYKYCKQCLKNRYNEDINTHRVDSIFKCPRCRDICNCPRCRKAKGLGPVGVIGNPRNKSNSALKAKEKEKQKAAEPEAPKVEKIYQQREIPVLEWRRIPINLSRDEADERILIREFLYCFGDVLDPVIAKSHLEELEVLGGRSGKSDDDDDDATSSWVTDSCVKAVVLGLLGLLVKDQEGKVCNMIKSSVKDLRGGGVTLNKMWSTLFALRDNISSAGTGNEKLLTFPDPKRPSTSALMGRSLRSARVSSDMINVYHSSQMLPVVNSLIHSALETGIIREKIEQGQKDIKDCVRDAKEAMKIENDRWEKEKKTMEVGAKDKAQKAENRSKRSTHKSQMMDIENALKIIGPSFSSRFMSIGTDNEDRVYYALSPGVAEREAAFEYLKVLTSPDATKLKKKGRVLTGEEREEMKEWSWFIAVWGRKPMDAAKSTPDKMVVDDEDNSDEEDGSNENEPRWWGFWDTEEITKLAEWISARSGIEEEDQHPANRDSPSTSASSASSSSKRKQPRMESLKKLVTDLRAYAVLLRWRTREDKYALIKGPSD